MIDDSYIIGHYFNSKGRLNGNHSVESYLKVHDPEAFEYLKRRYDDSESLRETFLRIYYGIEKRPKCPICGKTVTYRGRKNHLFNDTCANGKCYVKKREQTNVLKYGIPNLGGIHPEKIRQTKLERYGDAGYHNEEKRMRTFQERYGLSSNDPRFQKIVEKRRQTSFKRYGVSNPNKTDIVKQKIKSTCLERYGVDNYRKSELCKEKILATKKANGKVTSSKLEEMCLEWAIEAFGKDSIIPQYTDSRYMNPENGHKYRCDLYIKPYDIFIEIQGYWAHGPHPFDQNSSEDQALLDGLQEKTKTRKIYERYIEAWTISDPMKRLQAKENNLRYIEIFDRKITKETFTRLIYNEIRANNWSIN